MSRLAVVLLATCLAAGCGSDETAPAWDGPVSPLPTSGRLAVQRFNAYAANVRGRWERQPALVAAEFLRLDQLEAGRITIEANAGPEGRGPAMVTVLLDRLLDDSVAARRFELGLERADDTWTLLRARWAQRCADGRGHQDFSPAPCV